MTTILVIGFILLIILIIVVFLLRKRAINRAVLTAIIDMYPSGNSTVEFVPYSHISEIKLMKIALLYAVKIKYLLESEPTEIGGFYIDLIEEIIKPSERVQTGEITERISEFAAKFKLDNETPSATKSGERFLINLIEGVSTDFVDTKIPFRGISANLPISVILLLDEITSRLSVVNIEIFENQFRFFTKEMIGSNVQFAEMKRLNKAITVSFNFADEIANNF